MKDAVQASQELPIRDRPLRLESRMAVCRDKKFLSFQHLPTVTEEMPRLQQDRPFGFGSTLIFRNRRTKPSKQISGPGPRHEH